MPSLKGICTKIMWGIEYITWNGEAGGSSSWEYGLWGWIHVGLNFGSGCCGQVIGYPMVNTQRAWHRRSTQVLLNFLCKSWSTMKVAITNFMIQIKAQECQTVEVKMHKGWGWGPVLVSCCCWNNDHKQHKVMLIVLEVSLKWAKVRLPWGWFLLVENLLLQESDSIPWVRAPSIHLQGQHQSVFSPLWPLFCPCNFFLRTLVISSGPPR